MGFDAVSGRRRGFVALAATIALMGMSGCHKEEVWEPMPLSVMRYGSLTKP